MGVNVDKFVKTIVQSGIMTLDEVSAVQDTVHPGGGAGDSDAQALAQALLKLNKLTEYQVRVLHGGEQGLTLGNYIILDEIGSGGMGRVFKAQHCRMKRTVALKVLSISAMQSPDSVKRFQREVVAAARLNHPNIATAYDANEEGGVHYLVMEFVEGKSLAETVAVHPLPLDMALNYILQTAYALRYAHQQGIVHRDIKPANLLVDRFGTVKILDMGLARLDETPGAVTEQSAHKLTRAGQIMGTVDFMSPEQAEDTRQADARSDIYSLGCTLYSLLTGEGPYAGDTVMRKLLAHRDHPIPSLTEKCQGVPRDVDSAFGRMVAKKPQDRFQTMAEVILALEACGVAAAGPASGMLRNSLGSGVLLTSPRPVSLTDAMVDTDMSSDVLGGPETVATPRSVPEEDLMLKEDADRLKAEREAAARSAPRQTGSFSVTCKCGHQFSVKAEHEGKKFKCPRCAAAVLAARPAATASAPAPAAAPGVDGSLTVHCQQCNQRFTVSSKLAGKTVKCSKCQAKIKIPLAGASPAAKPAPDAAAAKGRIDIACQCGRSMGVGTHLAGKTVKCPACGKPIKVPAG